MFKKAICGLCAAAVVAAPVCGAAKTMEFKIGSTDLYVRDSIIEKNVIEVAPYTESDRTMVPVRIISENFGADVAWDETTSSVTIKGSGKTIKLTLGSDEAMVNGEAKKLDVAAVEKDGRTLVPLRFISEELGMDVEYVERTEQIIISDEAPVMTVNGRTFTKDDYEFIACVSGYAADNETWNTYAGQSPDMMRELVEQFSAMFKEVAVLNTEAEKNGFEPADKTELEGVVAELETVKDEYVYPYSLMAPGVVLYDEIFRAEEYARSYAPPVYTDEEIKAYYENNYVRAKHILIMKETENAKSTAEIVLRKLNNKADFDELCKEYNEDPGVETQPEGYVFTRGEMVEPFEKAAFALKEGELSDVVETEYGYHIIKREALPEYTAEMKEAINGDMSALAFEEYYNSLMAGATVEVHMTTDEIIAAMGR